VPRRSVFEVTKKRLLQHQCIREEDLNTSYIMPFNKKDVAVQTMQQNDTSKFSVPHRYRYLNIYSIYIRGVPT